jgi:predicted nuclease of restriction endonuclease-like RecB superfamily
MPVDALPIDRAKNPIYLDAHDHPWLRALIDEYERFAGRRSAELAARLREPLRVQCPAEPLRRARRVMDRLCKPSIVAKIPAPKVRAALFRAAATRRPREEALRCAAEELTCTPDDVIAAMFADLPSEKLLPAPPPALNPSELALRTNLALVSSLLARATRVQIKLFGNARDIVRYAQLRGLLCVVRPSPSPGVAEVVLEISGPLSLFRNTLLYGRTLASIVPRLVWCDRFELYADCMLEAEPTTVRVQSGDPIFPANPPERFDSKLEQRFARDFARAAPDWDLIREPAPVTADDALIFPDFGLVHRRLPQKRAWLEIVGFWTPAYLTDKLRRLKSARLENLILCVDEALNCSQADLPEGARMLAFKRRIDPKAVLALLEG